MVRVRRKIKVSAEEWTSEVTTTYISNVQSKYKREDAKLIMVRKYICTGFMLLSTTSQKFQCVVNM